MDNDTGANTGIDRVITCGARWGESANSYKDLMLNNGVCVLASGHGSIGLFRSIGEGDLIALKEGRKIIALGKPKLNIHSKTAERHETNWLDFLNNTLKLNLSTEQQEAKEAEFGFSVYEEIDVIIIEEWVILDTPIYYPLIQGTVTIRDEAVKKECIKRFNELGTNTKEHKTRVIEYHLKNAQHLFSQYSVMSDDNENKAPLVKELLNSINIILTYEPENKIAKQMNDSINKIDPLLKANSKELSKIYNRKANFLLLNNIVYIVFFIATLVVFIYYSFCHITTFDINSITRDNLIVFIVTKGFIASSMILSVFWIARFLNKRIHENVYLIEEYEYKALIFDSLQNLKVVFEKDIPDDLFRDIMNKIIENPAVNLLKIQNAKSDISHKNIKEIAETLNDVKKVANP